MSSNIRIQKNCEFCGNEFIARTLYTRYCSKSCNKKHYKQQLLEKNIDIKQGQENIKVSPVERLRNTSQEYFDINEAAQIMRISRRTLYRLIALKKIKKKKILSRTVILKEDIKMFFCNSINLLSMKKKEQRKEPVRIRQRELANGNFSLYLDFYWKGEREYDLLNLYVTEPKTSLDRQQNKQTLLLAEQIKAQRLIDLQSGKYKMKESKMDYSFIDYFKQLATDRLNSKGNYGNWDSTLKHLMGFSKGKDVKFADIDETWLNAAQSTICFTKKSLPATAS